MLLIQPITWLTFWAASTRSSFNQCLSTLRLKKCPGPRWPYGTFLPSQENGSLCMILNCILNNCKVWKTRQMGCVWGTVKAVWDYFLRWHPSKHLCVVVKARAGCGQYSCSKCFLQAEHVVIPVWDCYLSVCVCVCSFYCVCTGCVVHTV